MLRPSVIFILSEGPAGLFRYPQGDVDPRPLSYVSSPNRHHPALATRGLCLPPQLSILLTLLHQKDNVTVFDQQASFI